MNRERNIQPITRTGGWNLESGLIAQAKWCLAMAEDRATQYKQIWSNPPAPRDLDRNIDDTIRKLNDEARVFVHSSVVFAAMAVEVFLNFYGVVRLGEPFYAKNIERLGLVPKLSMIIATCTGLLLSDNDEIIKVLKKIADRRNLLVHPKAREIDIKRDGFPGETWTISIARKAVSDMDCFFKLFVSLDPESNSKIGMLKRSNLIVKIE